MIMAGGSVPRPAKETIVRRVHPSQKRWLAMPATPAVRYDDIHFVDDNVGWAINSNGQVLKTSDGGAHWDLQAQYDGEWLRCISMVDERVGWLGSTTGGTLRKTTDGRSWQTVSNLPAVYRDADRADRPSAICGLHALGDGKHVFAAGTNDPYKPTRFLRSGDGGESWTCRDMTGVAALLVDVHFENEREGWLVGGRSDLPTIRREDVVAAIWRTVDGGATWREVVGDRLDLPLGEWGWKIQLIDRDVIVVATESFVTASILISEDHGERWHRREIRDAQGALINCNIEGVGFIDRRRGWVGGWGGVSRDHCGRTSATEDGGITWRDATADFPAPEIPERSELIRPAPGQSINRFRVVGGSVYAAGNTIYKYTDAPVWEPVISDRPPAPWLSARGVLGVTDGQVGFTVELPAGARRLIVDIYDRFAGKVRSLVDDAGPAPGPRQVAWDLADDGGHQLSPGAYILRVSCDHHSESRMVVVDPAGAADTARFPRALTIPFRLRR